MRRRVRLGRFRWPPGVVESEDLRKSRELLGEFHEVARDQVGVNIPGVESDARIASNPRDLETSHFATDHVERIARYQPGIGRWTIQPAGQGGVDARIGFEDSERVDTDNLAQRSEQARAIEQLAKRGLDAVREGYQRMARGFKLL